MSLCFFYHRSASTALYTLSLHDALPIYFDVHVPVETSLVKLETKGGGIQLDQIEGSVFASSSGGDIGIGKVGGDVDRKSTRLNSSHRCISYAVFCLKKKNRRQDQRLQIE